MHAYSSRQNNPHAVNLTGYLRQLRDEGFTPHQVVWVFKQIQANIEVSTGMLWEYFPEWWFTDELLRRADLRFGWRYDKQGNVVEIIAEKQGVRVAHFTQANV